MNEIIAIAKGSDSTWTIKVKDGAGSALDMTVFANVIIILFSKDKVVVEKYSVIESEGWKSISEGVTNDELVIILESEASNEAPIGEVYFELRAIAVDGSVTDGKYDTIIPKQLLCEVVESLSSNLILPVIP